MSISSLMDAAGDHTLYEFGGILRQASYELQMLIFILIASIWLVASIIGAPIIIIMSRVLTGSAQVGAALLGGFVESVVGGVGGGHARLGGSLVGGDGAR